MCDFRLIILNSFGEIYLSAVQNLDLMRVFKSVVMNIRTISSVHKGFHFMNTRFSFFDMILCRSRFLSLLFFHAVSAFETYSTATPLRVSAL